MYQDGQRSRELFLSKLASCFQIVRVQPISPDIQQNFPNGVPWNRSRKSNQVGLPSGMDTRYAELNLSPSKDWPSRCIPKPRLYPKFVGFIDVPFERLQVLV